MCTFDFFEAVYKCSLVNFKKSQEFEVVFRVLQNELHCLLTYDNQNFATNLRPSAFSCYLNGIRRMALKARIADTDIQRFHSDRLAVSTDLAVHNFELAFALL